MNEKTKIQFVAGGIWIWKLPFTSVATPNEVPLTATVTPGNGCPWESQTVPLYRTLFVSSSDFLNPGVIITILSTNSNWNSVPNNCCSTSSIRMFSQFSDTVFFTFTSLLLKKKSRRVCCFNSRIASATEVFSNFNVTICFCARIEACNENRKQQIKQKINFITSKILRRWIFIPIPHWFGFFFIVL